MSLKCGLVGLPNVGKSTFFNAIIQNSKAEIANYPFCTIEPNVGNVFLQDERIDKLSKLANSKNVLYNSIEVFDIAGLVKGASKGEGLGNKFLSHIRNVDAIIQMIRCFDSEDIIHVNNIVDPIDDVKIIELELILSDLESAEKMKENLIKKKNIDNSLKIKLLDIFIEGFKIEQLASTIIYNFSEEECKVAKEFSFLTTKPIIYVANLDEDSIANYSDNKYYLKLCELLQEKIKNLPKEQNIFYPNVVPVCAKVEAEIIDFSKEEKRQFLDSLKIKESSLPQIAKAGFEILNYITYFTVGEKETRAWSIKKNTLAPKAAGVIHSDFEKGFIKAEVISYEDFIKYGSEFEVKKAGKMRLEGKDYIVQDGDIMNFKFNV